MTRKMQGGGGGVIAHIIKKGHVPGAQRWGELPVLFAITKRYSDPMRGGVTANCAL
jgi:hypothetical protein